MEEPLASQAVGDWRSITSLLLVAMQSGLREDDPPKRRNLKDTIVLRPDCQAYNNQEDAGDDVDLYSIFGLRGVFWSILCHNSTPTKIFRID